METVQIHISVTKQAADLLQKYCTTRTRGIFISDLVVAYDSAKTGGDGMLEALRKQANAAQAEASRLTNAYNKARELYQAPPAAQGSTQINGNGKNKRR